MIATPQHKQEAKKRMRQALLAAQQAEAMQLAKAQQTAQLAVATDPVSVPDGQVAGSDTMRKAMTVAGHQGLDNDVAVPLAIRRNQSGNERAGQDFRSVAIGGREFHMYGDGTIVKANARNPQQQATEFMQSARRTTDEDSTQQAPAPRVAPDEEMRRRVLERWVEENDPALERVKRRARR